MGWDPIQAMLPFASRLGMHFDSKKTVQVYGKNQRNEGISMESASKSLGVKNSKQSFHTSTQ